MRFGVRLIGLGLAVCAIAASPAARAADATGDDHVALSRQLIEAAGGEEEMKTLLQAIFGQVDARLKATIPQEQARQREAVSQKLLERLLAATPEVIDRAAQVYAKNLTDREMRDWIAWLQSDSGRGVTRELAAGSPPTVKEQLDEQAWQQSDSGRSISRKLPAIKSDTIQTMAPVIARATEGMRVGSVDEACRRVGCTPRDREVLESALAKALPKPPI